MTRARRRRGTRRRRSAREARERRARRVPAASVLPRPPERREEPDPCTHRWEEPIEGDANHGGHRADLIKVCDACGGFARRCPRCRGFHLAPVGRGGEASLPWWVSEDWLRQHGCPRRALGELPIPFVWLPDGEEPPQFELAAYEAIEDEPGRYELRWLS